MSNHLVDMVTNKVPVLTSRIDIATRGVAETDLLGGILTTITTQPTIGMIEILGGTSLFGGTSLLGGTKTFPNRTGTIVLVGTLQIRCQKGVIGNGTVHHRRVIIKLHA